MTPEEESDFLREIGERHLGIVQKIAAGMRLGNVEVAITYDPQIEIKEFTIRGDLLSLVSHQGTRYDYQD